MKSQNTDEADLLLADGRWLARLTEALALGCHELSSIDRAGPPTLALDRAMMRLKLLDAVLALNEPYRSAVILRYVEDREPRAIARLMASSVDSALDQARQGIEMLATVFTDSSS